MNLSQLRAKRVRAYQKELAPHLVYVAQSGFLLAASFIGITLLLYYVRLIRDFPADFPMLWVAVVCLGAVLFYSPIRTYLKEADLIYFLPMEHRIQDFFKPAWLSSVFIQSAGLILVLVILWPLYIRSNLVQQSFWPLVVVLLAVKCAVIYGTWQEFRVKERLTRWFYVGVRLALGLFAVYVIFQYTWFRSFILLATCLALYVLSFKLTARQRVPWQRLLDREQQVKHRTYLFLNWFVDVPELPVQVRRRRWMAWLTRGLPFKQAYSFHYLYLKTFLRTELFGITLRLLVLAIIFILWMEVGWLKAVVYFSFMWIIYIQLTSLARIHQFTVWTVIYPLTEAQRMSSIQAVMRWIFAGCAAILLTVLMIEAYTSVMVWVAAGMTLVMGIRLKGKA